MCNYLMWPKCNPNYTEKEENDKLKNRHNYLLLDHCKFFLVLRFLYIHPEFRYYIYLYIECINIIVFVLLKDKNPSKK